MHKLSLLNASDQYIEERKQIIVLTNNLQEIARAIKIFHKQHDCDISVRENDILVVLRDYEDRLWCKNVSDNNKIGFIPSRCLRRIGRVSVENANRDFHFDTELEDEVKQKMYKLEEGDEEYLERARILLQMNQQDHPSSPLVNTLKIQ